MNPYLESKNPRRKRDNQGNLIDSWEKVHFFPFKCEVLVYYGEAYDPAEHFNALLHSARKVFDVNNYLIPTEMTEEVLENLRLRINIAPNSVAGFSTDTYLLSMGFDSSQYRKSRF